MCFHCESIYRTKFDNITNRNRDRQRQRDADRNSQRQTNTGMDSQIKAEVDQRQKRWKNG